MLSRTLFIFFVLVALSAISSVSARGRGPGCIHIFNCTACTAKAGCGWCESTSQCFSGNSVGPGGNPNNCTEWFFGSCHIAECAALKTCLSCVADIFCGWCLDSNQCFAGTAAGPILGSCTRFVAPGNQGAFRCPSNSPSRSRRPSNTRSPRPSNTRTPVPSRTRTPTPSRSRIPRPPPPPPPASRSRTPIPTPTRTRTPIPTPTRTRTPTPTRSRIAPSRSRTPTRSRFVPSKSHSRFPKRSSNPPRSKSNTPSNSVFIISSSPAYYLAPTTFFVGAFFAMASFALAKLF